MAFHANMIFNVIQPLVFHVRPLLALVAIVLRLPILECVIVNRVNFGMDNDV